MTRASPPLTAPQLQKWLWDIREQEAARTFVTLIGERQTVLNIGPSWGRDYYWLSRLGKRVVNADIAPQYHLDALTLCDTTRGLPFAGRSFEVVLMAEVLEHLIDDAAALAEARRVLRDDGRLVVSVPFYSDEPEYHVRLHSPRTIRRLLNCAGFEPVAYLERGGLVTWPWLVHGLRRLGRPIVTPERFTDLVVRFDHFLARRLAWSLRHSPGYGCYLAARKSGVFDYRRLNALEFQH
jgi:SAM-dependent methyltransferase